MNIALTLMIQNLSFANHLSGQRKIDLVVFHYHLDEGNMKNTCVGWRNSCEQFENIRMALSSMLGGAARAVQPVQPATCLRCSRHVSRLCRCIHPLVKNDRERFTGIKSVARHPFHFPRCKVFRSEKSWRRAFRQPKKAIVTLSGERNRAQLRSDGWICSELKQGRRTQCQYSQKEPKRNPGSIDDKNALKESSRGSFKLCISRLANHIWNYKCLWSLLAVVHVILNADLNLEDKMWFSMVFLSESAQSYRADERVCCVHSELDSGRLDLESRLML